MTRSKVDYATDQITVYRSCPYGCRYCYVWRNKLFSGRILRGKYDPVEEAKKYARRKGRTIVVSFVSDPYPPEEREKKLTRRVLEVLGMSDNTVLVLTKNPLLSLRDIDVYGKHYMLGTTVITMNNRYWRYWEPNTLYKPSRRIHALKTAHDTGIHTWLSIEPIIPYTTIPENIVMKTIDYVDYYVLGAFNYPSRLGYTTYTYDILRRWYKKHVTKTIRILEKHSKPYLVKKELSHYLFGYKKPVGIMPYRVLYH